MYKQPIVMMKWDGEGGGVAPPLFNKNASFFLYLHFLQKNTLQAIFDPLHFVWPLHFEERCYMPDKGVILSAKNYT